jgi:hypothetical protein
MGYLTLKQRLIWSLSNAGLGEASIARKLNVTRQTIHRALDTANQKIFESLEETARINKIETQAINSTDGFLLGYSSHFKTKALITYSAKNGIQVWYEHEGNCAECKRIQSCRETLVTEAKERNIILPPDVSRVLPSKLAEELFAKIIGEGQNGHSRKD